MKTNKALKNIELMVNLGVIQKEDKARYVEEIEKIDRLREHKHSLNEIYNEVGI